MAIKLQLAERVFLAKSTELAQVARSTMAPADVLRWEAVSALYQQTHAMFRAARAEGGRFLHAFKFIGKDPDLSDSRSQQLYEALGGHETATAKLTAFLNAATDADRASVLQDSVKAKSLAIFTEFRTMNMLSSVKTQVVNTLGNAGTLSTEIWNRWLGEKMGKGQGIARGETWAMLSGVWDGIKKVREQWRVHRESSTGALDAVRNLNDMWDTDR
jgi:hypothetical protein